MSMMTSVISQALNKSYGKERRKRCIFRRLRKTVQRCRGHFERNALERRSRY